MLYRVKNKVKRFLEVFFKARAFAREQVAPANVSPKSKNRPELIEIEGLGVRFPDS